MKAGCNCITTFSLRLTIQVANRIEPKVPAVQNALPSFRLPLNSFLKVRNGHHYVNFKRKLIFSRVTRTVQKKTNVISKDDKAQLIQSTKISEISTVYEHSST